MALNVVENVNGQARISWPGAGVLFLGLVAACAAIPAAGFWLAFGDVKLLGSAAVVGVVMACCSFPLLMTQQLRQPLDRLPVRGKPGSASGSASVGAIRT